MPELTNEQFNTLLQLAVKHNPVQAVGHPMHGPGGAFSEPGVKPGMWSTIQRPMTFASALPMFKSEYQNELVSILTGQLDATGTNPTSVCGTAPVIGQLKKATWQRTFGNFYFSTEKVIVPEIGKLNNRADMERQILNMAGTTDPFVPDLLNRPGLNFRSELTHQLFKLGNQVGRAVAPVNITGNNTLTNAQTTRGWIKEFDGLDRLIATGYANINPSVPAPAVDSLVQAWGTDIDGTVNGGNIVNMITNMQFSRDSLNNDLGIVAQYALVMDRRLFRALAYKFAVTYASVLYPGTAGDPINRTAEAIEARFNLMWNNQYLEIQGVNFPVLFTAGTEVAVSNLSGNDLVGNIYGVPLTANSVPITYYEYFPMDNQFITEWNSMTNTTGRAVLNNGLYMTATRSDGFCEELIVTMQPRLMLDAPFMAWKLTDITFNGYIGYRDWNPSGTFHYNGGVTYYNG